MADTARARRLAKRIVTIVATQIQHEVKDPRLDMVTITAATVTPDLREATVYYTVYGDDDVVAAGGAGLASATGVLRSAVGHETGIKFTPTLEFKLDAVPANAHRIDELLAAARDADARVAAQAAGARYAGDSDPYKVPRVEAEEHDAAGDAAAADVGGESDESDGRPPGVDGGVRVPSDRFDSGATTAGERVP